MDKSYDSDKGNNSRSNHNENIGYSPGKEEAGALPEESTSPELRGHFICRLREHLHKY